MREHPWFQTGDRVRVRSWEDMEQEYGLIYDNAIDVPFGFTNSMRPYCGKEFVVTGVTDPSDHGWIQEIYGIGGTGPDFGFLWSNEMLEYADQPVVCKIDTIDSLL